MTAIRPVDRPTRTLSLLAACALLWCGSAVAAPPTEPPGKSGSAPGHQKHDEPPAPEASAPEPVATAPSPSEEPKAKDKHDAPPGHAEGPASKPEKPSKPSEPPKKPERSAGNGPTPAAAVPITPPPPPSSISAPGSSGPHKVTICHNGHAITVDAHGARTHVEKHGDTYAPAGSKGRAACTRHVRKDDPPARSDDPKTPEVPRSPESATPGTPAADDPAPVPAASVEGGRPDGVRVTPTPTPAAAHGTLAQAGHAAEAGTLPFTGRSLSTFVLLALALIALGTLVRRSQRSQQP